VGVAAIGYADGLPRAATGGVLLVRGKACPIIGHVCMDQCMLDLSDVPAALGERVVVTEESGSNLQALSRRAHTIPYELLCHLSRRAEKIYING
jgi:alanine racemase